MWAGFLPWPPVKQTSEVGGQRRSLVLTASFTSSTACSTSALGRSTGPGTGLWHLLAAPAISHKSGRHCDGKAACSDTALTKKRVPCINRRTPPDKRLLTQQSAPYRRQRSFGVTRDTGLRMGRPGSERTGAQTRRQRHTAPTAQRKFYGFTSCSLK